MASATPTPDRASSAPPASGSGPSNKFLAALSTINPSADFANLTTYPCARYSLLFGITAGCSVGLLRFLFSTRRTGLRIPSSATLANVKQGGNTAARSAGSAAKGAGTSEGSAGMGKGKGRGWEEVGNASNWAVGAFGVASLGAWETCKRRQTTEANRMSALVQEIKSRRSKQARPPPSTPYAPATSVSSAVPTASSGYSLMDSLEPGGEIGDGINLGSKGIELVRKKTRDEDLLWGVEEGKK